MKPLSELTGAELNEAFAVEVAGWKRCRSPFQSKTDPSSRGWDDPKCYGRQELPKWSISADAVMPWLEKFDCVSISMNAGTWNVHIYTESGSGETFDMLVLGEADAPTFARAACIALIEWKRREKQ